MISTVLKTKKQRENMDKTKTPDYGNQQTDR